jgi:hypothetical protein
MKFTATKLLLSSFLAIFFPLIVCINVISTFLTQLTNESYKPLRNVLVVAEGNSHFPAGAMIFSIYHGPNTNKWNSLAEINYANA